MSAERSRRPRVVVYEDRPEQLVGVKLLLLSLREHAPCVDADVYVPRAPQPFVTWLERLPAARLFEEPIDGRSGYDVKPVLLARTLENGAGTALWLDSDILITGDLETLLMTVPDEEIVVAEEPLVMPFQGGTARSKAWGMPAGRSMPATTNTSALRVSTTHRHLLGRWDELLDSPAYREAQREPWHARPFHLMGDQEVLCALLESEEFCELPVRFLRRGKDIAHCFPYHGYMLHQMLANIAARRQPMFVHCHGAKPWFDSDEFRLHLDVSPYTLIARSYADQLDESTDWMTPSSRNAGRMLRLSRDNPWTSSLPLAAYRELREQPLARTGLKRFLRKA